MTPVVTVQSLRYLSCEETLPLALWENPSQSHGPQHILDHSTQLDEHKSRNATLLVKLYFTKESQVI
jgi:hypothetical protein